MHKTSANGWRKGDSKLRRTHGARHGPIHFSAATNVVPIGVQRVARGARIKVHVVARNKFKNGQGGFGHGLGHRLGRLGHGR